MNTNYKHTPRVFSGVQPSGSLHLGNYLGAIKNFTTMQDDYESVFCVVDLHAITVRQDPKNLANQTREIAAAYLASGVDPQKSIIYTQSSVKAHTELAWYLNCVARTGWLNRMAQFKEKSTQGDNAESPSVGLYAYPILQAADILAFKATHVPVGDDQKQHLELAQNIAQKFNHDFGVPEFFPTPMPIVNKIGARIMSLTDGSMKMSKSDSNDMSRINLTDTADQISKKFRKAKTDIGEVPATLDDMEGRPELANLIRIYASLANRTEVDIMNEYGGGQYGRFKTALTEVAVETLNPITELMRRYMGAPDELELILQNGTRRASRLANPIVSDVRNIIGFMESQ